jgi:LysM repeat protein
MRRARGSRAVLRLKLVAAALLFLPMLVRPAHAAGEAAGSAAASFLAIGSGASSLAMAGATLASGHDLAAVTWNPAALARMDALQFSFSHAPLPGGASQDWLAAGGRLGASETRWGLHALFQQEGGIEGRDALNRPTGTLDVSDLAVGTNLARALGSFLSAGIGAQWLHESLAGSTGAGLALDAGVRGEAGAFGFALAARNRGGAMRYGAASYDLPGVIAAGASWSDPARGVRVNADFESPSHYYRAVRVGGEWAWRERVKVRAGYRHDLGAPADATHSGATFGMGAGVGGVWMDYAFAPEGAEGSGQHRVGLTLRPGLLGRGAPVARGRNVSTSPGIESARLPAPRNATGEKPVTKPRASEVERSAPTPALVVPTLSPAAPTPALVAPTLSPVAPTGSLVAPAVPPAAPTGSLVVPTLSPVAPTTRPTFVVVADGETMANIARRWGCTVPALMMTNNRVSDRVLTGQRLRLPDARQR